MQARCKISGVEFEISQQEIDLCGKMTLPLPTLCLTERMRQLMANRNEWQLYRRKCDATGDTIISAYHPDSPFQVYKNEYWWSDQWNALDYGRDYDFEKGFFEQYAELQKVVPREGTSVFRSENCDYNSHTRESRNCYMNSLLYRCEDTYYSYWMQNSKDCVDCYLARESELCYWGIDIANCYNCIVLQESTNCSDCHFSFQLRGCKNCLFCTNLNNKNYYIYNKPYSKEEFEIEKAKIFDGTAENFSENIEKFQQMKLSTIHRYVHSLNSENCSGDHTANCKNCSNCFESYDSEDCVNSISAEHSRDVHSSYSAGWPGCDRIYNSVVTRGSTNIAFSIYTFFSSNLIYCDSSNECHDCFGCIGLQHKKYCILNKQYSREEYQEIMAKIIQQMKQNGEWGQFFPSNLSPFCYNESAANDYFPLTEEQAAKLSLKWREKDQKEYLPPTKEILACSICQKNYKIAAKEEEFYKKHNLPKPIFCPSCRHQQRSMMRNKLEITPRKCDNCSLSINSSYASDRKEKVYCEECYNHALT